MFGVSRLRSRAQGRGFPVPKLRSGRVRFGGASTGRHIYDSGLSRRERTVRTIAAGLTLATIIGLMSAAYEVKLGDTLSEIASAHNTSVSALVKANKIKNPDLIYVGQQIVIPGGTPKIHRVATGETLSEIAKKYHTTVAALVKANDLANVDLIRTGQTLKIPGKPGTAKPVTHVVAYGETLASIAAKYGTTVSALAKLNGIANVNLIISGTKLVVKKGSSSATGTTTTTIKSSDGVPTSGTTRTHVVKAGETLSDIAAIYGVNAHQVAAMNGIKDVNRLKIGQVLEIPATPKKPTPTSSFKCPVPGAKFVNDYGVEKPDGRFHQGIDMFAPRGTSVYAPVSGTLEAINGDRGGLQFWLTGDDGNLYIGTHLQGFGLVGHVKQGDVIGSVGDTGDAIGGPTHLHFELLVKGEATNPYNTLRNACG